jgi:threonine dehydrogenase-like Zn-dependent dehydrogenase
MVTPVPDSVASRDAAFTTLGALALHALRQGKVTIGDRVVVIGLGVVGQMLAQAALAAGADVLGLDLLAPRRRLAGRMGVLYTPGGEDADVEAAVRDWTAGMGADCIFLCTAGGEGVVAEVCALARDRARLVVVGTPPLHVPRDPFFAKELTLTIARAYGPGRYDPRYEEQGIDYPPGYVRWTQERNRAEFLRLLARGAVRVAPLISHEFGIDDAPTAYRLLRDAPAETMGVLLRYDARAKERGETP